MATIAIQLLGSFRLICDQVALTSLSSPRLQGLFAYLLLHRETPQSRQQLAFLLYPDSPECQAHTNLRNLIHRLRQAVPDADHFLLGDTQTVQWRADGACTLDVAEFENAVAHASSATALMHAVDLYAGDLLPSCYDDWIVAERERLHQVFCDALERLILLLENRCDYHSAITFSERLLCYEPLREETYRHLMCLHMLNADRASALRVYENCAQALKQELDSQVSPATRQAYEQIANIAKVPAMVAKQVPPKPNNLPVHSNSFVGREQEMAHLRRLLSKPRTPQSTACVLTFTGAAGCGKTRLAEQLAKDLSDAFDDGAWWVELAPLSDPALVPLAVASALGVLEQPGQPLTEILTYFLRPKELLLVLDNCEHLIGACRELIQAIARACPNVQIIATSREALNISEETTWQVASLSLPETETLSNLEELGRSEAIRLFVDRACFVLPCFGLTTQSAAPVAQIVCRLDGLPLAIELAAARVRMLTPVQIAARLDNAFTLLTQNRAEDLPRHQTLQAAMDWSFDLLSAPERMLMRRLSVFAGGFTLESVESVCADAVGHEGILSHQVLGLLSDLVDKSLVMVVEWEHGEQARYRLLEATRQYAREKLLDASESEWLRDRHLEFFLNLAEQAEPMLLKGAQRAEWVKRLKVEQDNLRAALTRACERDPEVARWLVGTLCWFWFFSDSLNESRTWCERVLGLGDRSKKTPALAKALFSMGVAYAFEYYFLEAREPLEQSISLWHELGDQRMLAQPLCILAYSLMSLGQDADACAIFDENASLLRESADRFILTLALTYWGREIANVRRDYAAAKALHEESLALSHVPKDPFLAGLSFMNLGYLAFQQGEYAAARCYHLESLAERRQLGTRWLIAIALRNVADVMSVQGDYRAAQAMYEEALELHHAIGERMGAAWAAFRLGYVAVCRKNYTQAVARFAESLETYRESIERLGIASCLSACAEMLRAQGRQEEALRMLAFVDALLQSSQCKLRYVESLEYERTLAAGRAQVDEATFNSAWQAGRKMTIEQAMASALAPSPAG